MIDMGTVIISTTIGWFMGYRRGKRIRKPTPKLCPHGLTIDAVKCFRCEHAALKRVK